MSALCYVFCSCHGSSKWVFLCVFIFLEGSRKLLNISHDIPKEVSNEYLGPYLLNLIFLRIEIKIIWDPKKIMCFFYYPLTDPSPPTGTCNISKIVDCTNGECRPLAAAGECKDKAGTQRVHSMSLVHTTC